MTFRLIEVIGVESVTLPHVTESPLPSSPPLHADPFVTGKRFDADGRTYRVDLCTPPGYGVAVRPTSIHLFAADPSIPDDTPPEALSGLGIAETVVPVDPDVRAVTTSIPIESPRKLFLFAAFPQS